MLVREKNKKKKKNILIEKQTEKNKIISQSLLIAFRQN